ncbi:unnamed protein product [Lactuca saligna]|uniref:Uncharacterized protein n=1 Tax=Lactuca saligna TaxID=75948 RepID=A0AA35Y7R3_LACSI|nr:unnamed protein product [Lactuca saligna]
MVDRWIVGFLILDFPSISTLHPSSLIRSLGLIGKRMFPNRCFGGNDGRPVLSKKGIFSLSFTFCFWMFPNRCFGGNDGRPVDSRVFDSRFPLISALNPSSLIRSLGLIGKRHLLTVTQYLFLMFPNRCFGGKDGRWVHSRVFNSRFPIHFCFASVFTNSIPRSYRKKASSHRHSPSVSGCFQIDVLGETMVDRWIVGFLILDFPSISALHPSSLIRSLGLLGKMHLLTVTHLLFLDVSKSMFWGKRWSTGLIGKWHLLTIAHLLFLDVSKSMFWGNHGRLVDCRFFDSRFPVHFCFASVFTNSIPRSYRTKASSHCHSPSVSGCFQIDVLGETMVDRSYRKKGIFSPSLTNCVWMFPNRCFKGNDGRPKKASSHRHSPFWMFPNRCFVGNDGRLVDSLIGKRDLLTVTQLLFLVLFLWICVTLTSFTTTLFLTTDMHWLISPQKFHRYGFTKFSRIDYLQWKFENEVMFDGVLNRLETHPLMKYRTTRYRTEPSSEGASEKKNLS